MKKLTITILLLILLVLVVQPAGAMIGGEIDEEHTNIGAIVFRWPAYEDGLFRDCTATLIRPKVLVTAAHCTVPLANMGVVPDKVWITFETNALIGTPEYNPDLYLEIAEIISHPDFGAGKEYNDIALIILVEPVTDRPPVDLPPEGYMEAIIHELHPGKDSHDLDLIFVGYGATAYVGLPDTHLDGIRRVGTLSFVNLLPLEILTNNISPTDAIICDGDSGGPVFHVASPGKEVFIGLHARAVSGVTHCDGLGLEVKTRVDTASIQTWINANLP